MTEQPSGDPAQRKKYGWLALTVLVFAADYIWGLWYFGGLYREERLLSVSRVTAETLPATLLQNVCVHLPELLAAAVALLLLGRGRFVRETGLNVRCKKPLALPLAAGACLLALFAALLLTDAGPLAAGYQWVYYLVLTAFLEELTFRGLMPLLVERSGAPVWAVWIVPGVLFAVGHTLAPMVYNGFALGSFLWTGLTLLGGYTAAHCGFYALRRWSGTLWLPVLVHGFLDFSSIFI